jgi:hypothetical protein
MLVAKLLRSVILFIVIVLASPGVSVAETVRIHAGYGDTAEWTIMIYLNGDNNLEGDALQDFHEMADVENSRNVNIVVQFDRLKGGVETVPDWDQTLRFKITPGVKPLPKYKVQDIGEANMGDGAVLKSFVKWAMGNYLAHKYALIIWDHGQGYRLMLNNAITLAKPSSNVRMAPYSAIANAQGVRSLGGFGDDIRSSASGPYKSCSRDSSSHDELYNREIEDALKQALDGNKLDVLGFDCCLMGMVETAYAFRDVAKIFVGSEELEPGTGWDYSDWLKVIVKNPSLKEREVGNVIVNSYKKIYGTLDIGEVEVNPETTLSAIDLKNIKAATHTITLLSQKLEQVLKNNSQVQAIKQARDNCANYAPSFVDSDAFYHIDFIGFCDNVIRFSTDTELKKLAENAKEAVLLLVVANYKGSARTGNYGSNGLAIYFPPSKAAYKMDKYAQKGYEKRNTFFPVEFVDDCEWSDFLHTYFEKFK